MKLTRPQFACWLIAAVAVLCFGEFCLGSIMPSGVWLGMSSESLSKVRRDAVNIGAAPAENVSQFVEMLTTDAASVAYLYRFKDNELGAVLRTTRVSGLSRSETIHLAGDMTREYEAEFALVETQQIVRSFNAQSTLLSAQLWRENGGTFESYFLVSNHEITQVLFDPKKFGFDDFFLSAKRLPEIQRNEDALRDTLKGIQAENPESIRVPLMDLLKDVAKEASATPATESEPTLKPAVQPTPLSAASIPLQQSHVTPPTKSAKENPSTTLFILLVTILFAIIAVGVVFFLQRTRP